MKPRKHQADLQKIVAEIISGAPVDTVLANIVTGGGKSSLPSIMGGLIPAGFADKICWITPRKSLQRQGEEDFQDPVFRKMFGHRLSVRSSTNDVDPCRGLDGAITTYQAVGIDENKTLLADFKKHRYIIVLDEYHHAMEDGKWHESLAPLVKAAKYILLMTGTLERGDGNRIAFTEYRATIGGYKPELNGSNTTRVITYSRTDALAEQAIIPLHFFFNDSHLVWLDETGTTISHETMATVTKKDTSKAIYTAIATKYADDLLDAAIEHWQIYRTVNPRGKLLVVTAGKKFADRAVEFFRKKFLNAEIATSHESTKAQKAIQKFKGPSLDILVTIAMAYEGLDCKQISHIVALTHIRARSWLEQMFGRGVRVDHGAGGYQGQFAYVFAPDDKKIREVIGRIQAEQDAFVKKTANRQASLFETEPNGDPPLPDSDQFSRLGITPIDSSLTEKRDFLMDTPVPRGVPLPETKPPSVQEEDLRAAISRHINKFCHDNKYRQQRINAEIKRYFGKPRSEMTITELQAVLDHVRRVYPIPLAARERVKNSPVEGASQPRGRGWRPSRQAVRIN